MDPHTATASSTIIATAKSSVDASPVLESPTNTANTTASFTDCLEKGLDWGTAATASGSKKRSRSHLGQEDCRPTVTRDEDEDEDEREETEEDGNGNLILPRKDNRMELEAMKPRSHNERLGYPLLGSSGTSLEFTNPDPKPQEQLQGVCRCSGCGDEIGAPRRGKEGTLETPVTIPLTSFSSPFTSLEHTSSNTNAFAAVPIQADSLHSPSLQLPAERLLQHASSSSSSHLRVLLGTRQYDAAKRRLAQHPQEAVLACCDTSSRLTVLHTLVDDDNVPLEMIQSLLQASCLLSIPLLQDRNFLGQTPLHQLVGCKLKSPHKNKILQLILEKCPHLVFEESYEGKTVLDVFAEVWTLHTKEPESSEVASIGEFFLGDENPSNLHRELNCFLGEGCDSDMYNAVPRPQRQPSQLSKRDMAPLLRCLVDRYRILLHAAWKHQRCRENNQQQHKRQKHSRYHASHVADDAAQWRSRTAVARRYEPSSSGDYEKGNHDHHSPNLLQCATASQCFVPLSFLRVASKLSGPRAGWSRDEKGRVPLSMALMSATHYDVPSCKEKEPRQQLDPRQQFDPRANTTQRLGRVEQERGSFSQDDSVEDDSVPLELVDDDDDHDPPVPIQFPFSFLVQEYPGAASAADHEGRLPLHIALDCGTIGWHSGIQEIFMDAPEALNQRDCRTKLYPFQLAIVGEDHHDDLWGTKSLETAYQLLRANPDLLVSTT